MAKQQNKPSKPANKPAFPPDSQRGRKPVAPLTEGRIPVRPPKSDGKK